MEVTIKERIAFLKETGGILFKLSKNMDEGYNEMALVAKKVNVASAYKIQNTMGVLASNAATSSNTICKTCLAIVEEFAKTDYNDGEFKVLISNAKAELENSIPMAYDFNKVAESADGNEDMSAPTINQLNDVLSKYSIMSRKALLEVSDAASIVLSDDYALIKNVGLSVETLTNNIIATNNTIVSQVGEMVTEYKIILANLDDITAGLAGKVDTVASTDISVGSGAM